MHDDRDARLAKLEAEVSRLSDRDRQYRALLDLAADLVVTTSAEGTITSVSAGWSRRLGFDPNSAIGRPFRDVFHSEDQDALGVAYREAADLEESRRRTLRLRTHDGLNLWFTVTLRRLEATEFVAVLHDVTEQVQTETDLQVATRMLEAYARDLERRAAAGALDQPLGGPDS